VIGEAGVGYMLDRDYVVRPLMFDSEELEALMLGAQMVESWADPALAKAARQALNVESHLGRERLEAMVCVGHPESSGPDQKGGSNHQKTSVGHSQCRRATGHRRV
jgi:predicted DNA-binding transcriptional regulator YafY